MRLAVLGSGKGSNFAAIADACASGQIPAQMALVVSDVAEAGILKQASQRGLNQWHLAPGLFRTKLDESAESELIRRFQGEGIDFVLLAGFMRILKGNFLKCFEGRVINIHPSLLPAFPGLEAWKQALESGVKVTGCTVHFVDQGIDTGPIIAQRTVVVEPDDTAATLHERIQQQERILYPQAAAALARGELEVAGRQVIWHNRPPG